MEQNKDQWIRNYKNVTLRMTDGSILKGRINIREAPKLSMLFKSLTDHYITLVTGEDLKKIFIINRDYILWAESEE